MRSAGEGSGFGLRVALAAVTAMAVAGCVSVAPTPSDGMGLPDGSQRALASAFDGPTPRPTASTYQVRSGDTLYSIARRVKRSLGQLLAANPTITDPNRITVGQLLIIPTPDAPDKGPNTASIGDARDDVADPDGVQVPGQAYTDITSVVARIESASTLAVSVVLLHAPPTRADPTVDRITYTVVIDTEGDGQPNFRLLYGDTIDGQIGFASSFEDLTLGETLSGSAFPGTVTVGARAITFRLDRSRLGEQRHYAIAAMAERAYYRLRARPAMAAPQPPLGRGRRRLRSPIALSMWRRRWW
jgi:LysM repeat protein